MTNLLKKYMSCPICVTAGIFLFSAASLCAALTAEYAFGLKPCELCLIQRIPYAATAALGIIGLLLSQNPTHMKKVAFLVFVSGLLYLFGGLAASYHTGVERHWWASALEGCKADFGNTPGDLLAQIQSTPAVRCDEIPWADPVFGLSMANYNMLISLIAATLSIASSILLARRANGF